MLLNKVILCWVSMLNLLREFLYCKKEIIMIL